MARADATILAFYQEQDTALQTLRQVGRSGFRRAAAIQHLQPGRITVHDNDVSPRLGALVGGAVALGIMVGYVSRVVPYSFAATFTTVLWWLIVLAITAGGALLGFFLARLIDMGVDQRTLARFRRLVMPQETLLIVQAPPDRGPAALALLRRVQGAEPTTFVLRAAIPAAESPPRGGDTMRGERYTTEQLVREATRLASTQTLSDGRAWGHPLWNRLRTSERTIDAITAGLSDAVRLEQSISLAAEWLLDNAYIVRRHVGDVRRNLSRRFYDVLPLLDGGEGGGQPRIYNLAYELASHTDAEVHVQDVSAFLQAYQRHTPLTTGELWAMPLMLRLALIENLSHLAGAVDRRQHEHERADLWANRLLVAARRDPDQLLFILAELAREPTSGGPPDPSPYFADRLVSQLQGEAIALDPIRSWLERKLGAPVPEVIQHEQLRHAADQVTIANAISSLRRLSSVDWRDVFEANSPIHAILGEDPAGTYSEMDFGTRDRYRHVVEEVARQAKRHEVEVARLAIELARATPEGLPAHVGYHLTEGRPELERRAGARIPVSARLGRWVLAHPTLVYVGGIALLTLLIVWGAGAVAARAQIQPGALLVLLLLLLLPASEMAVQLVNYLATRLLHPRVLPKLLFEEGLPADVRTLVVVPVLLLSPDEVRDDLERLEIRFLANQDPQLHFALLADFPDAPQPVMPDDASLLDAAIRGIEALNERYPGGTFSLLYRQRQWSVTEQVWMGWERKRGKLEELNRLLIGRQIAADPGLVAEFEGADLSPSTLQHVGNAAALDAVRFVITLDSDSQLPYGAARRLVETLAHPLNRPRLGPNGQTVTQGYTIIQPRVTTTLPSATATRFSRVFTDPVGTDPYTQAVSDVYQDLAGEGSYIGKGIYDVRTFHRLLGGRFPDALLLSHDLVEGAHVRVGLATDIELFDQFPSSYLAYSGRQHRWIRGDWQVADWCTPRVPTGPRGGGRRAPNPISPFNRWKIFDNLRRSLVPASTVALLVAGWLLDPGTGWFWTLLGAGLFVLPPVMALLTWVLAMPEAVTAPVRTVRGWQEQSTGWVRAGFNMTLLPHQALIALDAIGRVFVRRWFTRRRLLQWQTARMVHLSGQERERRFVWRMSGVSLFAAAVSAALFVLLPSAILPALPFLLLWLLAPAAVAWLRQPRGRSLQGAFSPADQALLHRLARQTWRYFDDLVGPQTNWLPPDNYQEALRVEVAPRTSPTNIGLWLLSTLAARDFGYLTLDQVIDRGLATMETLNRLERFEGHLLNWYQIETLQPLPPSYVSMVDSGNLLASLWALRQGYEELLSEPVIGPATLTGLRDTLGLVREWLGLELTEGVQRPRINHLIATLDVLFDSPPDQLPEIVRRLNAATVPARELVAILGGGAAPPESQSPAAGNGAVPAGGQNGALRPDAGPPGVDRLEPESAQGKQAQYWARQVELQVAAAVDVVGRYLWWVDPLVSQPEDRLRPLGEGAREWRRQALRQAPSLRALASGEFGPLTALLALRAYASDLPGPLGAWLEQVAEATSRSRWLAGEQLDKVQRLIAQTEDLASDMNMRFLYDPERKLFAIGYNVSERRMDASFYDLLASEARLGSFVSIAHGDVPVDHWVTLGRAFGLAGGRRVLLSWSGTMFEYLMPHLLCRSYENSLLDAAARAAVAAQIDYGAKRNVPWGISEAAYAAVDNNQTYQYQAFGVPGLGLKRGLEEDLVVAPYAAMMALPVAPHEAVRNLRRLSRLGMRGPYGYYESIDYTPQRQPAGGGGVVVYTYMVHHQGMALLAIDNALHDLVMQRRFHADARVRAAEPLLFERIPVAPQVSAGVARGEAPIRGAPVDAGEGGEPISRFTTPDTPTPRTQLMSNGSYAVMVTSAGGGYSRWRDMDVLRWRADTTLDPWGAFVYVKDTDQGAVWSAAYQPVRRPTARYLAQFSGARAEFERRDAGIGTRTEICVSSEDDAEVRRVTLVNYSSRVRHLELTTYQELALAPHGADAAHPAFSKMFVRTELVPGRRALIAGRKPRSPSDPPVWAMHVLALPPASEATAVQHETDRARFIGRGRSTEHPAALEGDLSDTVGATLDPIFSLRVRLTLRPGERVPVTFVTGAAESRERILEMVEKYRDVRASERAFEMAWSQAQLEPRHLRVSLDDLQRYQQLASYMIFPSDRLRASERQLRQNRLGQSHLWAYGISGDLPILLVTIGAVRDLDLVREALMAHTYWRLRGFKADLVILDEEAAGYEQPLREELRKLIQTHAQFTGIDQPGGIFVRAAGSLSPEDLALLSAVARVVLVAARGPLVQQLTQPAPSEGARQPAPLAVGRRFEEEPSAPLSFMELPYFNGLGGFSTDGREYVVYLGPFAQTPAPWANVMANPRFGTMQTESGQGFAWSQNSQSNRLLPWSNDPVSDPTGDAIYIRDDQSGVYWTPTPLPIRELDPYRCRHGQGYTIFEHNSHAIEQELTTFVPLEGGAGQPAGGAPVRVQRLRLRNASSRRRRLSVYCYGEWVLGGTREETQMHVVTTWDTESRALLARNFYHPDFGSRVAFVAASVNVASYSGDRGEFLGRNGAPARPAALGRQTLSGRTGAGRDPGYALQVVVEIEPGQETEVSFLLGQAADVPEAREVVRRCRDAQSVANALQATRDWWDRFLGTVEVETPDLGVNFLLNRWLPYQTLSCRIWGRSAFYQSGGAFGFRDQLQDAMAMVYADPAEARQRILDAAAHQFKEGDVQHWWHPASGAGVRTRFSDDLLWLPFVTAHYVRATGDVQILDAVCPFLEGRLLEEHEHEIYFPPDRAADAGTLLEHCRRSIRKGLTQGPHGLPLMGTGDWNDGMSLVGAEGKGESVWLAWFLIDVLHGFADLLDRQGTPDAAAEAASRRRDAASLSEAIERSAWDGAWYRRAYFDDGTPLGSHENDECQIDSIAQSWGVISGAAPADRAAQALRSADERLVKEQDGLILLFTPPFEHTDHNPGYIKGYPAGVRENGGQYTHGAIWLAMAFARRGDGDRAVDLLRLLNPVEHARDPEQAERYKVEPYVVAADVYNLAGHVGRGGWTWYTGSSGWMYRVWLEEVLGFKLRGERMAFDPVVPRDWDGVTLRYRAGAGGTTVYEVTIRNPERVNRGVVRVEADGQHLPDGEVPIVADGGTHRVVVTLGAAAAPPDAPADRAAPVAAGPEYEALAAHLPAQAAAPAAPNGPPPDSRRAAEENGSPPGASVHPAAAPAPDAREG
ncbi:MAG TPA: glucoamylase family protein [Chloroflexota bacterium]|nr:glucoamylase family protein [Chloroflexota bacterium]